MSELIIGNQIRSETISGLEEVVEKVMTSTSHSSQKGDTSEIIGSTLIIENPQKNYDDTAFPFWTEKQTKWYLNNFLFTKNWIKISKEVAEKFGRKGSSYCYYLRYHENDGGLYELNTVLRAISIIPSSEFPIENFQSLYEILDRTEQILPDVSFSVLKHLKYEKSPKSQSIFEDIKKIMKNGHIVDIPLFAFTQGLGSVYFPNTNNTFEDQVVSELKESKNTRRAFISGIYNLTDVGGRIGRPPFSAYQAQIRNNKIIGIVNMRSNDMLWGAQLDIHHALKFAERISEETGADIGPIILQSASAHAYKEIPFLKERGYETREDVQNGGVEAMKLWLSHVTATLPAEYYPEL